jgi:hypothetical protein
MSQGHIRPQGEGSWQLKFDLGRDPVTGKRKSKFVTFCGNKRQAQAELILWALKRLRTSSARMDFPEATGPEIAMRYFIQSPHYWTVAERAIGAALAGSLDGCRNRWGFRARLPRVPTMYAALLLDEL